VASRELAKHAGTGGQRSWEAKSCGGLNPEIFTFESPEEIVAHPRKVEESRPDLWKCHGILAVWPGKTDSLS
jgi:hypothetical protein